MDIKERADLKISISTGSGTNSFQTKKISGILKAFIINTDEKVHITIKSELGYTIWEDMEYVGNNYIPIGVAPQDAQAHGSQRELFEYFLDESLLVTVEGQQNKEIDIRVRYV